MYEMIFMGDRHPFLCYLVPLDCPPGVCSGREKEGQSGTINERSRSHPGGEVSGEVAVVAGAVPGTAAEAGFMAINIIALDSVVGRGGSVDLGN